jgi:hypothetical protein
MMTFLRTCSAGRALLVPCPASCSLSTAEVDVFCLFPLLLHEADTGSWSIRGESPSAAASRHILHKKTLIIIGIC